MSKKNQYKELLDKTEFDFDQVLLTLREADENGKLNKKLLIQARTLKQLVSGVADDVLERSKGPMAW